ncbi:hypothetical protein GUITHDRAFT_152906 [Guillardia theta CCMP2712]|uniref:PDZ domain-containing protein n=1 Tax=Guillardia theta (strain CCMP2712) TaxID=905079 RepID=L1J8B1_GUITC|nr:hypothetical protein GUITHDRAFT_152906 [Guillardia theta CCMP2712]EKX44587.1 hypothetical protein GUITHDRAFT_152906 [Guillardia theta CCMP2712]|eukprot:XP_005831567.1 hypothetical protein GUITHDRAFT_152906 [Guillardia theta CCMP2712]
MRKEHRRGVRGGVLASLSPLLLSQNFFTLSLLFLSWICAPSQGFSVSPKFHLAREASSTRSLRRLGIWRTLRADVTVTLKTPLGIVFEEIEAGQPKGLFVKEILSGGNADRNGQILVGDKLVATSAVILDSTTKPIIGIGGAANTNWKRTMIPCGSMDFENVMAAIKSNSGRYGYDDVRITVRRTDQSVPRSTTTIQRSSATEETASSSPDLPLKTPVDEWKR